ncbi:MAG: DUF6474 family protein [Gordonia sp. (in: high G+C Gram-positive bacteria)]|uniref:DUF6474 family protein n=1 Tax=Gordonia sp. (in: high G+C Gram-positive bacteria) TaxID=84139 RepID=UPI0039E494EE
MPSSSSREAKRHQRRVERKIRKAERKADRKQRRSAAKAEKKATEQKARIQVRAGADEQNRALRKQLKTQRKHLKKSEREQRRTAKTTSKAQQKAASAEAKNLAAQAKAAEKQGLLHPTKVKRYLSVAKMLAPIAGPVIYRGSIAARQQINELQARRAGVPSHLLNQYGGPTAAQRARIDQTRATTERVAAQETTDEGVAFVQAMNGRLDNLVIAADAADTMPPTQRRAAQRAIDNELTAIDNDLLARLNVHPS